MTASGPTPVTDDVRERDPGALHVFYGGTFDPVHFGHLAVARGARDALDCPIRMMPAADPPHRAPPGASAGQRARMLALAIDGEPGLVLDERELHRVGPSYSVDTLRELRQALGDSAPIALLVGADSLLGLPDWHDWTALTGLAHFVVADRPGNRLDQRLPPALGAHLAGRWTDDPAALRSAPAGRVLCLHQPLHPGSATEIRRRIADGAPWRDLVPGPVADYIVRHRLYGVHGSPTGAPL